VSPSHLNLNSEQHRDNISFSSLSPLSCHVFMQTEPTQFQDSASLKGPKYHPLFTFDADVVLTSHHGVFFSVPSMTLKMTSAWCVLAPSRAAVVCGAARVEAGEEWPTTLACWATKCRRVPCLSSVYDKVLSSKAVKDLLDSLPNAVEVPVYETA
jgi:hypothetical protein